MSDDLALATRRLRDVLIALRGDGLTSGDALNALAAVAGELVREAAAPGYEPRLARDVVNRIHAHASRR